MDDFSLSRICHIDPFVYNEDPTDLVNVPELEVLFREKITRGLLTQYKKRSYRQIDLIK